MARRRPVRVTGWVSADELVTLIDEIDVLLFPSLWEGMSLSLIQAQAQGIPAVVSDVVAIATASSTASRVRRSHHRELIAATARLLADPPLRERCRPPPSTGLDAADDDRIGVDSLAI